MEGKNDKFSISKIAKSNESLDFKTVPLLQFLRLDFYA